MENKQEIVHQPDSDQKSEGVNPDVDLPLEEDTTPPDGRGLDLNPSPATDTEQMNNS